MGEEYTNKLVASFASIVGSAGLKHDPCLREKLKKNNGWLIGSLIKHYDGPQYVYR